MKEKRPKRSKMILFSRIQLEVQYRLPPPSSPSHLKLSKMIQECKLILIFFAILKTNFDILSESVHEFSRLEKLSLAVYLGRLISILQTHFYSTMESKTNAMFGGVSFYFSIKNIYHGLRIPQKEDRQA